MTKLKILGASASNYVRTARMACVEKGVEYELAAVGDNSIAAIKAAKHLEEHPFGRIPVMHHGTFKLFETSAICQYIDEAFEGPALQPSDVKERAAMTQWISALNDYVIPVCIGQLVRHYAFPAGPDGQPDMKAIEAGVPLVAAQVEIVEKALDGRTTFTGDQVTIADLFLLPVFYYVGNSPGGMAFFEGKENIGRWWQNMASRPSFEATIPGPPPAQAAE
jgi:glutathione S-transferase